MTRLLAVVTLLVPAAAPAAPPAVTAVAYSPQGKAVAFGTAGEVRLFDPDTGEQRSVGIAAGRVTALAFDPTGKWLAVACGEAGKTGEVRLFALLPTAGTAPNPLVTFPAHTDAIYALTFAPDGKTLATAGYDRLIHLWSIPVETKPAAKPRLTLKDHSDAVYGLSFHPDGHLLASAGADRAVKVWDVATGRRLYTLGDPTDWVYAVAWSPDRKHLAAGGVDKSVRVWAADKEEGKLVLSAFAHEKPLWRLAYTADGKQLYTLGEDGVAKVWDTAKLTEAKVFPAQPEAVLDFALRPDGRQLALARFDGVGLLVDPATSKPTAQPMPGKPGPRPLPSDRFPVIVETGMTDSARAAQNVTLHVTIAGAIDRAGDADFFRFDAKAGDEIGVQVVTTELGSKLEPVLVVTDADGMVLAEGAAVVGFRTPKAGGYAVGVRDREYRGGADFTYRLNLGDVPVVTGVFPLAAQRGRTTDVHIDGVNLGTPGGIAAKVTVPAESAVGSRVPVPLPAGMPQPLGKAEVVVAEFPAVVVDPVAGADLRVPGSADGILTKPNEGQLLRFTAKKGQRLVIEAHARRAGSPVDPVVEVLDAGGKPVPRALLRASAKTYTTFRDHDATGPGIRLDTWNELAIDDYLYVDGELMRIVALPKNPDDDCQFYQVAGQRVGYLGTTPTHHSQGSPMYKVEIHPPGKMFPPNGLPVFPVYYRNDDGGAGFGKDSYLMFEAPEDGTFQVRVTDARGSAGPGHAYRVTVRPPKPDFAVSFNPTAPAVWKGGSIPVSVTVTRIDGFDGPVQVQLDGLPAGFHAPPTFVEAGHTTTAFALFAEADAVVPKDAQLKLVARAAIGSKEVKREAAGGAPKVVPVGDITTCTSTQEITLRPGQETRFVVDIERQGKFTGRVPIEVRGLPHGVRVLNIGLNGILITERETKREVVLYAEPWVKPMEHPIVVLAVKEGTNAQHGARSVLLKIGK